jgi:phosphatidylserine synthase 2
MRVLYKLAPSTLEKYEWSAFLNLTRYLGVASFCTMTLIIDCNNFFYKYLTWIPADHLLIKYRIVLWGFVAIATSKEWYEYVSNPHCHRLGPFAWLTFYVSAIELSSVYKFRGNEFQNPFPWWINTIWIVIFVLFALGAVKAF